MNPIAIVIFLIVIVIVVGFVVWALLQDAFVRIDPGDMGLVVTRGKPADHGIPPGTHFALRFGRVIQIYPAMELAYLATSSEDVALLQSQPLTYFDPPLRVTLGDRAEATIQYTIRFTIVSEGLPQIYRRTGPGGMGALIRDESRLLIIALLNDESVSLADAFGSARIALESRLAESLRLRLAECGFAMTLFNLREMDLAGTGTVIQAERRAREELALEQASAAVRLAHAKNDAAATAEIIGQLSEETLRFLQLQVWREMVVRWDGKAMLFPDHASFAPWGALPVASQASPSETTPNARETTQPGASA